MSATMRSEPCFTLDDVERSNRGVGDNRVLADQNGLRHPGTSADPKKVDAIREVAAPAVAPVPGEGIACSKRCVQACEQPARDIEHLHTGLFRMIAREGYPPAARDLLAA